MATYKKGFKKQNTETVLLKVIIGIIVAVFGLVAIAFIYDAATQWKDYSYYTTITEYDGILEYTNGGDEALQDYVVYFYADDCSNCATIKNTALKDGNKLNKNEELFFIADTGNMNDETENFPAFLDSVDLSSTEFGTPALLIVVDGEFYGIYVGASEVTGAFDLLLNDEIPGFDR